MDQRFDRPHLQSVQHILRGSGPSARQGSRGHGFRASAGRHHGRHHPRRVFGQGEDTDERGARLRAEEGQIGDRRRHTGVLSNAVDGFARGEELLLRDMEARRHVLLHGSVRVRRRGVQKRHGRYRGLGQARRGRLRHDEQLDQPGDGDHYGEHGQQGQGSVRDPRSQGVVREDGHDAGQPFGEGDLSGEGHEPKASSTRRPRRGEPERVEDRGDEEGGHEPEDKARAREDEARGGSGARPDEKRGELHDKGRRAAHLHDRDSRGEGGRGGGGRGGGGAGGGGGGGGDREVAGGDSGGGGGGGEAGERGAGYEDGERLQDRESSSFGPARVEELPGRGFRYIVEGEAGIDRSPRRDSVQEAEGPDQVAEHGRGPADRREQQNIRGGCGLDKEGPSKVEGGRGNSGRGRGGRGGGGGGAGRGVGGEIAAEAEPLGHDDATGQIEDGGERRVLQDEDEDHSGGSVPVGESRRGPRVLLQPLPGTGVGEQETDVRYMEGGYPLLHVQSLRERQRRLAPSRLSGLFRGYRQFERVGRSSLRRDGVQRSLFHHSLRRFGLDTTWPLRHRARDNNPDRRADREVQDVVFTDHGRRFEKVGGRVTGGTGGGEGAGDSGHSGHRGGGGGGGGRGGRGRGEEGREEGPEGGGEAYDRSVARGEGAGSTRLPLPFESHPVDVQHEDLRRERRDDRSGPRAISFGEAQVQPSAPLRFAIEQDLDKASRGETCQTIHPIPGVQVLHRLEVGREEEGAPHVHIEIGRGHAGRPRSLRGDTLENDQVVPQQIPVL